MEFARKKGSGDAIFHISKLQKSDNGTLSCKYCGTDIQYVSAHTRGASKTPVSEYLKLWQDEEHSNGCSYSVRGAVDLLVSDSKSVENANPIFELQDDGSYLFRMNILIDAQRVAQNLAESCDKLETSRHLSTRRNYIRSEEQIASYFRSAAGIAKLRSLIQESSDVEELKRIVKIQYKDDLIPWNDFYYDDTRYHVLFNRLTKGSIPYPIAISATLKGQVGFYKEAKHFPWSFQCYSQIREGSDKNLVYIPRLQLAKENFHRSLSSGDRLLIVGDVWANKVKDNSSIFRNLNISVFNKSQFKKELDAENNT